MSDALYDSQQQQPRMTPAVQWLLAANIGVYFLQLTLFRSDAVFRALGLSADSLTSVWWTPVTYMFVHAGLWHLAFNMFALWMFGPRVEQSWNTRGFTYFYLWCGLGGAVAHLLLQGRASLIGASAAVSGVMLAYALRWPDEEVYLFGVIPMKTRWLVVWMVLINLAMGVASTPGGSGIAWFSHLGGLAFGWLYLRMSSFGGLDNFRRWVSPVPDEPEDAFRAVPKVRPRNRQRSDRGEVDEVVAKSNAVVARPARSALVPLTEDSNRQSAERLDVVLDKISKHGIESLTSEEVRILEDMSRKLRGS
ncbi:MAG TPA: rhomboid family intramembrane serine protease [Gemmatimonadaceae bacterium]|nr:rhomboid family intramembrane serine protease [Gemmatimonadaceae bacterium]